MIGDMLGLWNAEASKIVKQIDWEPTMKIKQTDLGNALFVDHGSIPANTVFAALMGDIVISPVGSTASLPATNYDVQLDYGCVYKTGTDTVCEYACYIRGTSKTDAYNGQMCNHSCLDPNAAFVDLGPVVVTKTRGQVTHSLSLPLIGVKALERIEEGSECLVNYGDHCISEHAREGFIPCRCSSCVAGRGRFIMG
jgi:hypothetical protein